VRDASAARSTLLLCPDLRKSLPKLVLLYAVQQTPPSAARIYSDILRKFSGPWACCGGRPGAGHGQHRHIDNGVGLLRPILQQRLPAMSRSPALPRSNALRWAGSRAVKFGLESQTGPRRLRYRQMEPDFRSRVGGPADDWRATAAVRLCDETQRYSSPGRSFGGQRLSLASAASGRRDATACAVSSLALDHVQLNIEAWCAVNLPPHQVRPNLRFRLSYRNSSAQLLL
jgi:hypothetical protein